jgi:hypothetical protein
MLFINRLVLIGLLSAGIAAATTAQAANQMFTAEWYVQAFGNELTGIGTGASAVYSVWGIPEGIQCNDLWPRCPFNSTPTDGAGNFHVLGGTTVNATYCAPWQDWNGNGATMRPAKGQTSLDTKGRPIPPLFRDDRFFTTPTANAQPNLTYCNATSTDGYGGPGKLMVGKPITGTWTGATSTAGGFSFAAAPGKANLGMRTTGLIGDFQNIFPYIYSYTYATLRNDQGTFGPGGGPGNFTVKYYQGANAVATARVKQGLAKFGGTMRLLGAYTTKVCYFRQGGCSLGTQNWRYDAIGTTGSYTVGGVITQGYLATYKAYYYHTALMQKSTVNVVGSRFPWTTGTATLKATGRGPHKTVHYGTGYDNRNPVTHKGTVQLVTPVMTRWLQPAVNFETGGVAILRIKFVPEPQTWAILVAGISLLGVGYRMRGR